MSNGHVATIGVNVNPYRRLPTMEDDKQRAREAVGEVIRQRIAELGLTQEQAAERLGIATGTLWKYLRGTRCPQLADLPSLARALHLSSARLAERIEEHIECRPESG